MEKEPEMKFHPLANAFPLLEGAEFAEMVESVRKHGQLESIVLYEDQILDGRNRARACKAAGVEVVGEEFEGTYEQAREFVISANITRRHLDPSQRAMIAAKLATLGHGSNQWSGKFAGPQDQEANLPVETQAKAAERLNVSERSVRNARKVIDKGAPEVVRAVERGEVSVSKAARIADLPKEEQTRRIAEPKAEPRPATAPPLRNLVNISGGELARWIKITTPNNRTHVIRVLEMAAAILRAEHEGQYETERQVAAQ
jgi:ParB-like chromosome segregation protein Spo0J